MNKSQSVFRIMKQQRLLALLDPENPESCVQAYEILQDEGILLEIALRSPHALPGIRALLSEHPEALILAGTVMTPEQAEDAIQAGAAGIVSADYVPEVIDVCAARDVMCIPGGLTDAGKQLSRKAQAYGCSLEELKRDCPYQWIYKLFPAFAGPVSHIDLARAWRGPYKDLCVVYTGGISLANLAEAARKDHEGIYCASALTRDLHDPERMRQQIRAWKDVLKEPKPSAEIVTERKDESVPEGGKIVTFGELMLRLSPSPGERLAQADTFSACFGGAEANVAVSLAHLGMASVFVTALPDNALGDNALRTLRFHGVNTRNILRRGKRMGIYYLEHGSGPRPSRVVYDRSHSAVSELGPGDLDWDRILEGAVWFHWTGITPALSHSLSGALREGLETARQQGITVSVDLNYRGKLWTEVQAREVMSGLMSYVDICIGNEEDPARIFGINPSGSDIARGKLDPEGYREVAESLHREFGFRKVAITLRESISASENHWSACLFNGEDFIVGPRHHVRIIDRVGSGDAFAAGMIFSLLSGKSDSETLSFAVAAAVLKHSLRGDFNPVGAAEVERLAGGEMSGRILR